MSSSIQIPDNWPGELLDFIIAQEDYENFLTPIREEMLPPLDLTFAALKYTSPEHAKVLVLGLDPYPRKESACGIAFHDASVTSWNDKFAPSLRNILLNLFSHTHSLPTNTKIQQLRAFLSSIDFSSPNDWFEHSSSQGVIWLNSALTYSPRLKQDSYKTHSVFWKPIILFIVKLIMKAKIRAFLTNSPFSPGVVIVLWGKHAQSYGNDFIQCKIKALEELAMEFPNLKIGENCGNELQIVEAPHPCFVPFHKVNSFEKIEFCQELLGQRKIEWIKTNSKTQ
ncbi:hypothetical protein GEMRC1_011871 [Eukaryota sp. GEM-RC1]